jgi:hypothetical protein
VKQANMIPHEYTDHKHHLELLTWMREMPHVSESILEKDVVEHHYKEIEQIGKTKV